jgi:hypothetical protein
MGKEKVWCVRQVGGFAAGRCDCLLVLAIEQSYVGVSALPVRDQRAGEGPYLSPDKSGSDAGDAAYCTGQLRRMYGVERDCVGRVKDCTS